MIMALRIQNNVEAFNAHRNLSGTESRLAMSMERLSSGYRINRAADDAANVHVEKTMLGAAARVVELAGDAGATSDGVPPDTGTASAAAVSGTEAAPAEAGGEGTQPR